MKHDAFDNVNVKWNDCGRTIRKMKLSIFWKLGFPSQGFPNQENTLIIEEF